MKTFVMMTKLSAPDADIVDYASKVKSREHKETALIDRIQADCPEVKFTAHYALLGPWDFMDIYEAPDEDTAARVSIICRQQGVHQVESWIAIPNERLQKIEEDLGRLR